MIKEMKHIKNSTSLYCLFYVSQTDLLRQEIDQKSLERNYLFFINSSRI